LKQDPLSIDPRSQNSQSENDLLKHKLIYERMAPLKLPKIQYIHCVFSASDVGNK